MIKQLLLVGLGGGIGSILRFSTSLLISKYYTTSFPVSTFTVNIIGCFIIGILMGTIDHNLQFNTNLKFLFITGFCGGYTTFSAFAFENFHLLENNSYLLFFLYVGLSVLFGVLAVWFGFSLAS